MATWIAHLYIAEELLNKFNYLDIKHFIVANIASDYGVQMMTGVSILHLKQFHTGWVRIKK